MKGTRNLPPKVRRHLRLRRKVIGTAERPRLSVYRSLKHITAQIVNDAEGRTLLTVTSTAKEVLGLLGEDRTKLARSKVVGRRIAELAKEKGIVKVVFDRGGYLYHGRIRALADAAREAGLSF
jgi:large subunit ribosomal protein L18